MSHHHTVAETVDMPVFYCDTESPCQRPSNVNTNGLLRDYFPKGINLLAFTAEDLIRVGDELNDRPHKTLDWQTPHELFASFQTMAYSDDRENPPNRSGEVRSTSSFRSLRRLVSTPEVCGNPE